MIVPRKIFLFYLMNGATGNCYYVDAAGNVQQANIHAGIDISLKKAPAGWIDTTVSFGRSAHYWGINRTFTEPFRFVGDGAKIIRTLFYTGRGIEEPLILMIFRWNPSPVSGGPNYDLFYSGRLDLSKIDDTVAEAVGVNIMEGGIVQLLKAYENTIFEIPCDGSIPENIKTNFDGMLFEDTLFYQFVNFTAAYPGAQIMPASYISNEGDNVGIVKGEPSYEQISSTYYQTSGNYLFTSVSAITVRIKGSITVKPTNDHPAYFQLYLATSQSVAGVGGSLTRSWVLIPNGGFINGLQYYLTQQTVFNFDLTTDLNANENLFLGFFNQFQSYPVEIIGGSFQLSFNSKYPATRAWGITAYDLFRLLVKSINEISSTAAQLFNYAADSTLLQEKLNFIIHSGDALRASGDPNYNKYYNAVQTNPNWANINQYFSYGPVIKTSLADFFDSLGVILCGSLSNQQLDGERESVFFERLKYVFDNSSIDFDLGEVSGLKVSMWEEMIYNRLRLGYAPQSYDQKAGKYETNTTAEYNAPIKSRQKLLERISKYRTDPYGIEKLRSNTGGTSTTKNDSDNSVFLVNVDRSSFVFDYYKASFLSTNTDPTSLTNTNIKFISQLAFQGISLPTTDGTFFTETTDTTIFMFNQPGFATAYDAVINFTGYLLGNIGDTLKVKMWVNGVLIQTWSYAIVAGQVNFSETFTHNQTWHYKDLIYFTCETSVTAQATFATFDLNVGSGYFECSMYGATTIAPGQALKLISLPNITATQVNSLPVISYGFEYLIFNQVLINPNFDVAFHVEGLIQGGASETLVFDVFVNGVLQTTITKNGTTSQSSYSADYSLNRDFSLGDFVFVVASVTNLTAYITVASLTATSTQIKAYSLLRKKYDSITGIPPLPVNSLGQPDSSIAGAPYNIEELSPKRVAKTNGPLLRGPLFNQIPGKLTFQTLDKNQYQSTTLNGETITENADIDISDLASPYFYPILVEFKTKVPYTFAQLQSYSANGHIKFSYNGKDFYCFIQQMSQKPALDEAQTWKGILSPSTNLANLVDLNFDGLQLLDLNNLTMFISPLNPFHFVLLNYSRPAKYHTSFMDQDWFINTIDQWTVKQNYFAPVQKTDVCPIQVQTKGLSPVTAKIYKCDGTVSGTHNFTQKFSNALPPNNLLWEWTPDFSGLDSGQYYILVRAGSGGGAQYAVTEGLNIQDDQPGTILFEANHSVNKLATVFDTGFTVNYRVEGLLYYNKPKSVSSPYVDQPQDIELLNAIPFDTYMLFIGGPNGPGIPDWAIRKSSRIMTLNNVKSEGLGIAPELNAEWDEIQTPGQPRKYWTLEIRPNANIDGVEINEPTTEDSSIIVSLNASVFGPNAQNQGTQEPDITNVTTS